MSYPPQGLDKADVLANQTTLLTRLTAARAEYLDTLPDIENHLHATDRVFGKSGDQSGNNWATHTSLTLFRCISGNGDFGGDADDEAKVIGSEDTPFDSGKVSFDLCLAVVGATSSTSLWIVRLIWGTGTMSAAESAGQYIEFPFLKESAAGWSGETEFTMPNIVSGTKVWVRGKNATDNATLDFLVRLHEYD